MTLLLLLAACAPSNDDSHGHPGDGLGPDDSAADADTDSDSDADSDADSDSDSDTDTDADADADPLDPPLGATSGGSGGVDAPRATSESGSGASWLLLAPTGSARGHAVPLLVVISGTEGATTMMSNMSQVAPYYGLDDALIVVLDGTGSTADDAAVALDATRAAYDVDNDRTWLLSESAGTTAGLELGFHTRPSYFAAYWANDVNNRDTPALSASDLGFQPSGNAGPGGDLPDAQAIVDGMRAAGWALPADAPYSGSGSTSHGSTDQFLAAVDVFADKSR